MKKKQFCPYCGLEISKAEAEDFNDYHEFCYEGYMQEIRDSW